jgi:hypothetical protein
MEKAQGDILFKASLKEKKNKKMKTIRADWENLTKVFHICSPARSKRTSIVC